VPTVWLKENSVKLGKNSLPLMPKQESSLIGYWGAQRDCGPTAFRRQDKVKLKGKPYVGKTMVGHKKKCDFRGVFVERIANRKWKL